MTIGVTLLAETSRLYISQINKQQTRETYGNIYTAWHPRQCLLRSTDCFVVIWKHFCFILSTGTKIRTDPVTRPRSSSRGNNTSASVTVTVRVPAAHLQTRRSATDYPDTIITPAHTSRADISGNVSAASVCLCVCVCVCVPVIRNWCNSVGISIS